MTAVDLLALLALLRAERRECQRQRDRAGADRLSHLITALTERPAR